MVSAFRRLVACLTLLLPFETMASDVGTLEPVPRPDQTSDRDACVKDCAAKAAPQPTWGELLDGFGLLLPKIPQMPSACRPVRQYRSISLDKMPRQPCFYA